MRWMCDQRGNPALGLFPLKQIDELIARQRNWLVADLGHQYPTIRAVEKALKSTLNVISACVVAKSLQ
jgi:hypothetical protein